MNISDDNEGSKEYKKPNKAKLAAQTKQLFGKWGTINKRFGSLINTAKFGDVYSVTEREIELIKKFIFRNFPILEEKQVNLKIGKLEEKQEFNVIFLGKEDTPLSSCCKLTLCLNIKASLGNAKIYCMEKLCQFNPLF